jgi:signal transduction histidine kinase
VWHTERPARIEQHDQPHGAVVGTPIVVDGRLWGAITAGWADVEAPPADSEERVAQFAELLDTAIANADSRDQLTASRTRLLTEADEARRRVVRDLHDGAQQRQVHTIITLKLAQRAFRHEDANAESFVAEALEHATQGHKELRELAHGILPSALARGGLAAGVSALVARFDLPVEVDVAAERLPAAIEASAYFIVAEALTNVVKHAHSKRATITAHVEDGNLRVRVRDDGVGGARSDGSGLLGLADRLAVLNGRLRIESPADGGTLVAADIPLAD